MRFSVRMTATALIVSSLTLGACTTTNPYTREEQTSKATIGTGIGVVAGAALGLATGKNAKQRRNRALIGAGIGGLSGGGIGYYMDTQEMELRQQLEGTGVSVTRQGDAIILNMPGNITFPTDSADVRPGFDDVLHSVALVLEKYPKTIIQVDGHTDSTGSAAYNKLLSERRAESVAGALRRHGVDDRRIIATGYGPDYPIASDSTPQGREQNRRVELALSPLLAE